MALDSGPQELRRISGQAEVAAGHVRKRKPRPERELKAKDWLEAARQLLIEEGIGAVKALRIAKLLGVTRGGFHWRFRGVASLHVALIEEWQRENSRAFLEALRHRGDVTTQFNRLAAVWFDPGSYLPEWDSAMRDWGRVSPEVARAVQEVDDERTQAIANIFVASGQKPDVALVRARVIYYHQVGYYALGVREGVKRRRDLLPIYRAILTGSDPDDLLAPD